MSHRLQLMYSPAPNTLAEPQAMSNNQDIQDQLNCKSTLHLGYLFRNFEILSEGLHTGEFRDRRVFQQLAVNTQYFKTQILNEVERLEGLGIVAQIDGRTKEELCIHFHDLQNITVQLDYQNSSRTLLDGGARNMHYPAPRLFLVLPAYLNSWSDSDPTTHIFRLHFICDFRMRGDDPDDLLRHVHLSNHQGYSLQRPQEFFQAYGNYALRLLQVFERGYTDEIYDVPPLDTFKILTDYDANVAGSRLSKDIIRSLVAKSIAYIQELSLSQLTMEGSLTCSQSVAIKSYLDIHGGDHGEGGLHRYISPISTEYRERQHVYWMCQAHAQHRLNQETLEDLMVFAQCHGGHVEMQHSRLKVDLDSKTEADQFISLVQCSGHIFDISIKLRGKVTRSLIAELCQDCAGTGATTLELDGITLDIFPRSHVQYSEDLFSSILLRVGLRCITLLNYPRPREQRIYVGRTSLQLTSSPAQPNYAWMELHRITENFWNTVLRAPAQRPPVYNKAVRELKMEGHISSAVIAVTISTFSTHYAFDLNELAFIEVYTTDLSSDLSVLYSGYIQQLTALLDEIQQDKELFRVVQANRSLQELNISFEGHNILRHVEHLARIWWDSSTSSCLTLIDRLTDNQGRVVAKLSRQNGSLLLEGSTTNRNARTSDAIPSFIQQQPRLPMDIEFLQWSCDNIVCQLDDSYASFLDTATQQHPSVLTLFTLDISRLSRHGLTSIEMVLRRSSLEHLHVICTSADPSHFRFCGSNPWFCAMADAQIGQALRRPH